jgi:3-methyladenine DNA glycosylase AlkD
VIATGVINQIQVDVYADCDWVYKGPDDDVSVLHTLSVDPDARGRGAGPAFVRFWEDLAAEEGCSILRIDTNALNKRARRMYAGLGYIESGIVPTIFNGLKNVDLVMMEKFIGTDIQRRLREMQDTKYADFQMALIPGMERERAIGVRTPQLRALAKELYKASQTGDEAARRELEEFIGTLPHKYFDEMQLHAFIISEIKDFALCMAETERFLPHVDNWATCDQLSPKVFRKHKQELLSHIDCWLGSEHTYTVRFGIGMLMQHFLDEDFDISYMDRIAEIRSDEYYINMMIAWYFATALAKQPEPALAVLKEQRLAKWTRNKAIQKAIESRRITDEQKEYLRTLKIR